ncbi:hypothetical protein P691DRAFT_812797 [Macrolepiota fuliginosa MF-IS2]|uniref:F-box domain-containing protein n=1 Tax=Macrolepiota fuliginosa MF-IS2 TaxID=1400762 RepID=A0A9P5WZW8_9AGAR|nr:hypothetical protein P691DRAFT_812797 [Macrolepiota fuliginosa MF-IS2]
MSATTTCPCCHQQTVDGTTSLAIFPSNLVPQAEIELIHNEASRLQGSIDQIRGALAVLFRRLNAIQSATRALPPETLSHIFQYVCARIEGDTEEGDSTLGGVSTHTEPSFVLTLGSVSAQWRDVIRSTPRLWSVLDFKLKPTKLNDHISLIKHSLIISGSVPLDVTLDFSGLWNYWYQRNHGGRDDECDSIGLIDPSIDDVLFENMSRMESLHLSVPPPKWITSIPQFSRLSSLSMTMIERGAAQDLCLVDCTSLRHLTLIHFGGEIRLPRSPVITSVVLYQVSIDTALELLFCCQSLIYYDGSSLIFCPFEPSSQFATPTTLKHLRTFKLDGRRYNKWHDIIMRCLHFPALEELHWYRSDAPWPNPDILENFFHRLPSVFKTLCFNTVRFFSNRSLINLFPSALEVECIVLADCDGFFISEIAQKLVVVRENGPPVFELFPKLRKLTIVGSDAMFEAPLGRNQVVVEELFRMLEKRLKLGDNRFCLEIPSFGVL